MHKVVLFEILHGRAARFALNGGTIMSGQYFTVVQPFYTPKVFGALFPLPNKNKLSYAFLRRIWNRVPREFSDVPTCSGYKPIWNHHLSRGTMLAVKGIARTGLYKRAVDYTSELSRVRWGSEGETERILKNASGKTGE